MDLTQGTPIINRDNRRESKISGVKQVTDRRNGGTKTVYKVNNQWLTELEINRDYLIVGVDPLPTEHGW